MTTGEVLEDVGKPAPPIVGFGISGHRTLRDVRFVCAGPFTVICGPNNTGKSSLLEALRLYPSLVQVAKKSRAKPPEDFPLKDVEAHLAIDMRSSDFHALLREHSSEDQAIQIIDELVAKFGGPLWVKFVWGKQQGKEQLVVDKDVTFAPIKELLSEWNSLSTKRRLSKALLAVGGSGSGTVEAAWLREVARKCVSFPNIAVIPDVRRAADRPLSDEDLWGLAQASARRTGDGRRVQEWADRLEQILQDVFGPEVRYEVRPTEGSGDFRLRIDGEDDIQLGSVGAGVREVVAIAHAALATKGITVLAIEEPENCLHPIAVKRLVRSLVRRSNVQLFVSTHASAVVNANPDSVVHLTRHEGVTTSREVDGPRTRYEAVRSLGYSPADLVLTPCAVWVEGPSDRLYLAAWLRHFELIEGIDYQIMFYGGALAAHVSVHAETLPDQALAAIRNLGRHCVLVADSDKERKGAYRKKHVRRFGEELANDEHAHLLVTAGREIENYLPLDIVNKVRADYGGRPLKRDEYLYSKVVDPGLQKRVSKIRFAQEALALLDGAMPDAARADMRALSNFIREAP